MTKDEAQTKPLWEVWEHFQELLKSIPSDLPSHSFASKHHEALVMESVKRAGVEISMLRAALLDRCESEPSMSAFVNRRGLIKHHKESAAYHSFWAWELEKRGKEGGNG